MPKLIRPPDKNDATAFLRMLFLRTEQRLLAEIRRKRSQGYVDYAGVAALKRTRAYPNPLAAWKIHLKTSFPR